MIPFFIEFTIGSLFIGTIIYSYMYPKKETIYVVTDNNSINYTYCNELNQIYFKKKLNLVNKNKFKKYNENKKLNNDFIQGCLKQHKLLLNKSLVQIENKDHYYYWLKINNFLQFKNYNYFILNLESVFNYKQNNYINLNNINYIDKFCHNNKIIFFIIGEIYPDNFQKLKPKYFNLNNYISPYHYKSSAFSSAERLPSSKYRNKYVQVTINKILLDIKNRLGISDDKFVYIGNTKIKNFNNISLK